MADTTFNGTSPAPSFLSRIGHRIWNTIIALGEAHSRAQLAREISMISDEELERRGITRADLVRRVMLDGYGL